MDLSGPGAAAGGSGGTVTPNANLFSEGSDDSDDSEYEKSDSSAESGMSEELSEESEKTGKHRKTRWERERANPPPRCSCLLLALTRSVSGCRAATKKDEEKQRSYKQKKKRRRIKVQESSSSNEKVFEMFPHPKKSTRVLFALTVRCPGHARQTERCLNSSPKLPMAEGRMNRRRFPLRSES